MLLHSVKMHRVDTGGLLGVFDVCIGDFVVLGCKLVVKPDGSRLVIMPASVHPISREGRAAITEAACRAYEEEFK